MPTPYDLTPYLGASDDEKMLQGFNPTEYFGSGDYLPAGTYNDGLYYWGTPGQYVPVPTSEIPGTRAGRPSKLYRKTAENVRAIADLMPYLNQTALDSMMKQGLAELDLSRITSPGYAQLQTDLFNQYGPQLNAIGNEIMRRNALAQAETDKLVMQGPGRELVQQALDTAKLYDPEFYNTRASEAQKIQDLFNSIDLTGALSETERREIEQGLAREGQSRGTYGAPSNTETVANAMQYGSAGTARKQQAQNMMAQAIQASSQFLPASRSGVDTFMMATGKPSTPNQGASQFTGVTRQDPSNQFGLAGQLFGGINDIRQIEAQKQMDKTSNIENFLGITKGLANIGQMVGGIAGGIAACWVAREVYGQSNPKWMMFRDWLINCSPVWFYKLYMTYGPAFAKYISDKPRLKLIIKRWMDKKIYENSQKYCNNKNRRRKEMHLKHLWDRRFLSRRVI